VTTTTPESRGRLAYTAFCRGAAGGRPVVAPLFDELPLNEREGWIKAAGLIWDLATTGRATL
jgi:hypothetical protein